MKHLKSILVFALSFAFMPAYALQTLTCISNNIFQRCDLPNADQRDVSVRSVVAGDCMVPHAWGVDSSGIWVNNGCGAVFQYGKISTSSNVVAATAPSTNNYYYNNDDDGYDFNDTFGLGLGLALGFGALWFTPFYYPAVPFYSPFYYFGAGPWYGYNHYWGNYNWNNYNYWNHNNNWNHNWHNNWTNNQLHNNSQQFHNNQQVHQNAEQFHNNQQFHNNAEQFHNQNMEHGEHENSMVHGHGGGGHFSGGGFGHHR